MYIVVVSLLVVKTEVHEENHKHVHVVR